MDGPIVADVTIALLAALTHRKVVSRNVLRMRKMRTADFSRSLLCGASKEMKDFLRPYLSEFRWFRRWYGGRWGYWQTSLSMPAVWLNQWHRPPCGEYMIAKEHYSDQSEIRRCAATISTDPPQDCDAPFCGCNPEWDKVLEMLQESGWKSPEEVRIWRDDAFSAAADICRRYGADNAAQDIQALVRQSLNGS